MSPEDLTPREREEVQMWYLRSHFAKLRRKKFARSTHPGHRFTKVEARAAAQKGHAKRWGKGGGVHNSVTYAELKARQGR